MLLGLENSPQFQPLFCGLYNSIMLAWHKVMIGEVAKFYIFVMYDLLVGLGFRDAYA